MKAQLIADVYLYPTDAGGKKFPIRDRYGCPCFVRKDKSIGGWDCWILTGGTLFAPGERRRVGFVFLSGQTAVDIMKTAGKFYLWELRFIGEATVIAEQTSQEDQEIPTT